MKPKKFIMDDVKVKRCISNISKMNVKEYRKYLWPLHEAYINSMEGIIEYIVDFGEGLLSLLRIIPLIIGFILLPILHPIHSSLIIKQSRKIMREQNKRKKCYDKQHKDKNIE